MAAPNIQKARFKNNDVPSFEPAGFDVVKEVVVGRVDHDGTGSEHPLRVAFNLIREDILLQRFEGGWPATYAFPDEDGDHTITVTIGRRKQ